MRIIGLAAAGLAVLAASTGYGLWQQSGYQREAETRNVDYARHTIRRIAQSCDGGASEARATCLRQGAQEYRLQVRNNLREYEDLAAQKTSALWTSIMGVAALLGMALSAIGVALVWTTFRETRRSADLANSNFRAFLDAERCRIKITPQSVEDNGGLARAALTLHLKLSNIGRSPATLTGVTYQALATWDYPVNFDSNIESFEIVAAQAADAAQLMVFKATLSAKSLVGGYVDYQSQFGQQHRSHFLFQLRERRLPSGVFVMEQYVAEEQPRQKEAGWPADY
jgi:hypothetical protein